MTKPAWKTAPDRVLGQGAPADWYKGRGDGDAVARELGMEVEEAIREPETGMAKAEAGEDTTGAVKDEESTAPDTNVAEEADPKKTCCKLHALAKNRSDRRLADRWCVRARAERRG